MKQSFTLNQCLRLIYGETSARESAMLTEIIRHNDSLRQEFSQMKRAFDALCSVSVNPSKESVEAILRYNRDSACLAQ